MIELDATALLGSIGSLIVTGGSLLVWLVKRYEQRHEQLSSRYFAHLERSGERAGEVHAAYQSSIREMGERIEANTSEMRELAGTVGKTTRSVDRLVAVISGRPCGQGVTNE